MKHNIIISTILSAAALFFTACIDNFRDMYLEAPKIDTPSSFDAVDLSALHVEGRYLKNAAGETVNLHGFAQTFSPYFNNSAWSNYDVDACLQYNQKCFDGVLAAGWKVNFVRQHMDPYWSCGNYSAENVAYKTFNVDNFMKYLNLVFIPMAEYAIERGCYVVMRPPGVCPETIAVDDKYNKFLIQVWDSVSNHPKIKNNPGIMFEIANEPVNIVGTDGATGASTDGQFEALKLFLQPIVDVIRENGCNNVLWLPGLGYQSLYGGCAKYKVEGSNLGYAVHCYCGWYGSDAEADSGEGIGTSTGGGYTTFQQGWDKQVKPVTDIAPIMVTEMDWALSKYNSSWGKGITGTAGAEGFGANFKYIADNSGNVSWLLFTGQELLMQFKDEAGTPGEYTFLNDPEACPWPIYHWFEEYADVVDHGNLTGLSVKDVTNGELSVGYGSEKYLLVQASFSDGTTDLVTSKCEFNSSKPNVIRAEAGKLTALCNGEADVVITYTYKDVEKSVVVHVVSSSFSLDAINPHIWDPDKVASYDKDSHTLITAQWGFGGWEYQNGIDLSASNYLIIELCKGTNVNGNSLLKIFGENNYWGQPATYQVNDYRLIVDLRSMKTETGVSVDPSHLYIIGFWTNGGKENAVVLNRVYVADEKPTDTYTPPGGSDTPDPEEPDPDDPSVEDLVFSLGDLNPNVFKGDNDAPGTFDPITHELQTAIFGFGGWSLEHEEAFWDLSKYHYLIVELGEGSEYTKNAWSFRLFDTGYWGGAVEISLAENVQNNHLKIDLTKTWMTAGDNSRKLDMTKVNIVGFWSYGNQGESIYVNKVYATNKE